MGKVIGFKEGIMRKVLLVLLILLGLFMGCMREVSIKSAEEKEVSKLTVTGEGKVTVVPDMAVLNIGVEARAKKVRDAQREASEAMSKIFNFLAEKGILKRDIKTTRFLIEPVFENKKIVAYRVYNLVNVKIRDIDKTGEIIDGVVEIGGDLVRIRGINFTSQEIEKLYGEARKRAVKDAINKAYEMADAADIRIVRILSISEGAFYPVPVPRAFMAEKGTPVSPGEMEIKARVKVVFEIKD